MNWLLNCMVFVAVITAWIVLRGILRSMGAGARQRCRDALLGGAAKRMAKDGCPRCGAATSPVAQYCPRCGVRLQQAYAAMPPALPAGGPRRSAGWIVFQIGRASCRERV